jgi:hypothetical protein
MCFSDTKAVVIKILKAQSLQKSWEDAGEHPTSQKLRRLQIRGEALRDEVPEVCQVFPF